MKLSQFIKITGISLLVGIGVLILIFTVFVIYGVLSQNFPAWYDLEDILRLYVKGLRDLFALLIYIFFENKLKFPGLIKLSKILWSILLFSGLIAFLVQYNRYKKKILLEGEIRKGEKC